ncbi:hypothetical protein Tco_1115892, partial [Tanacetum coccineum]
MALDTNCAQKSCKNRLGDAVVQRTNAESEIAHHTKQDLLLLKRSGEDDDGFRGNVGSDVVNSEQKRLGNNVGCQRNACIATASRVENQNAIYACNSGMLHDLAEVSSLLETHECIGKPCFTEEQKNIVYNANKHRKAVDLLTEDVASIMIQTAFRVFK